MNAMALPQGTAVLPIYATKGGTCPTLEALPQDPASCTPFEFQKWCTYQRPFLRAQPGTPTLGVQKIKLVNAPFDPKFGPIDMSHPQIFKHMVPRKIPWGKI
jgi:hypothetical protein